MGNARRRRSGSASNKRGHLRAHPISRAQPEKSQGTSNNFATSARIAESRGIDWLANAESIAKLTVFQTEFPHFAADLHFEPRLPALLRRGGLPASDRARQLIERHRLSAQPVGEDSGGSEEELADESADVDEQRLTATDSLLVPTREQEPLISQQRENLRRYLETRANVPDPSRQLLYLEAGGAVEGLADPDLGELLEREAPERPQVVVDGLQRVSEEERIQAVSVLAGMAPEEFGVAARQRRRGSLWGRGDVELELGAALDASVRAVRLLQEDEGLQPNQLVGALRLGLEVLLGAGAPSCATASCMTRVYLRILDERDVSRNSSTRSRTRITEKWSRKQSQVTSVQRQKCSSIRS